MRRAGKLLWALGLTFLMTVDDWPGVSIYACTSAVVLMIVGERFVD